MLKFFSELEKQKNKGLGTGMSHFYRKLLEETEQQHEATVAAAAPSQSKTTIGPQAPTANLTITKPADWEPKSDLELARVAREQGKDIELNDDNQIVDKRELLSAGLNLSAPNTRKLGLQLMKKQGDNVAAHTAVGTAASRREINERRAREVAQQMQEEQERVAKEREQQEHDSAARIMAKRNTEESVKSARERYLERKRQKMETTVDDDASAES